MTIKMTITGQNAEAVFQKLLNELWDLALNYNCKIKLERQVCDETITVEIPLPKKGGRRWEGYYW